MVDNEKVLSMLNARMLHLTCGRRGLAYSLYMEMYRNIVKRDGFDHLKTVNPNVIVDNDLDDCGIVQLWSYDALTVIPLFRKYGYELLPENSAGITRIEVARIGEDKDVYLVRYGCHWC